MLKINTEQTGIHCDGLSRRNFLQIGSLAMGGMALPQLLRAEAEAGCRLLVAAPGERGCGRSDAGGKCV